jgi:hypothetical protein
MLKYLTFDQITFYSREDYLSPIPLIAVDEAAVLLGELGAFKAQTGESVVTPLADKPYLLLKSLSDLSRHPGVLDAIEERIGSDILLAEVGFFWKEPGDPYYAAWNQDATICTWNRDWASPPGSRSQTAASTMAATGSSPAPRAANCRST